MSTSTATLSLLPDQMYGEENLVVSSVPTTKQNIKQHQRKQQQKKKRSKIKNHNQRGHFSYEDDDDDEEEEDMGLGSSSSTAAAESEQEERSSTDAYEREMGRLLRRLEVYSSSSGVGSRRGFKKHRRSQPKVRHQQHQSEDFFCHQQQRRYQQQQLLSSMLSKKKVPPGAIGNARQVMVKTPTSTGKEQQQQGKAERKICCLTCRTMARMKQFLIGKIFAQPFIL